MTDTCKIIKAIDEVNAELLFVISCVLELGGGMIKLVVDWVRIDKRASLNRVVNL